ncbi:hypothetical protein NX059_002826 [Plenodomus lindquistii]|nr:hypothetical protein NX059_002826 [Plenodomus lindquistii]
MPKKSSSSVENLLLLPGSLPWTDRQVDYDLKIDESGVEIVSNAPDRPSDFERCEWRVGICYAKFGSAPGALPRVGTKLAHWGVYFSNLRQEGGNPPGASRFVLGINFKDHDRNEENGGDDGKDDAEHQSKIKSKFTGKFSNKLMSKVKGTEKRNEKGKNKNKTEGKDKELMLEAVWHTPSREPKYHRNVFASETRPVKEYQEVSVVASRRELVLHAQCMFRHYTHGNPQKSPDSEGRAPASVYQLFTHNCQTFAKALWNHFKTQELLRVPTSEADTLLSATPVAQHSTPSWFKLPDDRPEDLKSIRCLCEKLVFERIVSSITTKFWEEAHIRGYRITYPLPETRFLYFSEVGKGTVNRIRQRLGLVSTVVYSSFCRSVQSRIADVLMKRRVSRSTRNGGGQRHRWLSGMFSFSPVGLGQRVNLMMYVKMLALQRP